MSLNDSLEYGKNTPEEVAKALRPIVACNLGLDPDNPPDEDVTGVVNELGGWDGAVDQQEQVERLMADLQEARPPGIEPDPSLVPPGLERSSERSFDEEDVYAEYIELYTQEADVRVDQFSTPDLLVIIRCFIVKLGGPALDHTEAITWETVEQAFQILYQLQVNHDRQRKQIQDLSGIADRLVAAIHAR